ncbi:uncharacterized protein LOC122923838 [Bufo gargarizans]|uniref:uncharacterized protein LOC122923838 n=1 Tax=Bufo gargarizans TaxID=30331 RepID=UPI001CF23E97|nr:uncharacterized protein LOC122923838 [Bufo gargarizans]XP_044130615.1 uncharacterized protein LOC122923838 [Bufo gargarizans]
MKIFLSSLTPVYLIFTLIPSKVTSDTSLTQTPSEITLRVGQSATITCSIEKNIDIREMQFWKNKENLLNLTIQTSDISSKIRFSGTFGEFKWILDDGEHTDSYICTAKTEMNALKLSEGVHKTNQIDCPSPDESSTNVILNNGSKKIASLSVIPGEYRSRLDISGTILSLTLTLKNVNISDIDSYQCKGRAKNIAEDSLHGKPTILNVKNHGKSSHTGNLGSAFAMVLASWLFKL